MNAKDTQDDSASSAGQGAMESGTQEKSYSARPINGDQVAWMLNAFGRYLPPSEHPRVSRAREMLKYALLYEIMEVAHLHFADDGAQHNGTPHDVRAFRWASKQDAIAQGGKLGGAGSSQGLGRNSSEQKGFA